jgi:hypothetical protein
MAFGPRLAAESVMFELAARQDAATGGVDASRLEASGGKRSTLNLERFSDVDDGK